LHDTGNRCGSRAALLGKVVSGDLDAVGSLFLGSSKADPSINAVSVIQDEDFVLVQLALLDGNTLSNLGNDEGTSLVGDFEENSLVLVLDIIRSGSSKAGGLASEEFPEVRVVFQAINDSGFGLAVAFFLEGLDDLSSFALLTNAGGRSVPLVDHQTSVQKEGITSVEGRVLAFDFSDTNLLAALDVHETGLVFSSLDLLEARVNTTLEDVDLAFPEGKEFVGLRSLNLAELNREVTKVVIELDSLVSGSTHLILRGLSTQPEVNVVEEFILVLRVGIGVEDDVRVTSEEGTISLLGDGNNFELLNAPDFLADFLAAVLPSRLLVGSSLLEVLVILAAVVGNVGIFQLGTLADLCQSRHDCKGLLFKKTTDR